MRSRWMLWVPAAGLLLGACRTDGERGEAAPAEHGPAGGKAGQIARVLAAMRSLLQGEVDAGKLAQQRASSPEVKDYATRVVAEDQASLDALRDLVKAKKIDLDAVAIQGDPLLRAEKELAKDGVDRLRTLSGTPFDAAYMTAQRPSRSLLGALAQQGPATSRDADVGNILRTVAQQGREQAQKAGAVLPKACGGERPGWGGTG
jgi:predicted outer membrane protein